MNIESALIEGIIAGLSGALAAVISVLKTDKYRRRNEHRLKHMQNFEVLKGAINKVRSDLQPFTDIINKENLLDVFGFKVNRIEWKDYCILNYMDTINKNGTPYFVRGLDKLLLDDIEKHWSDFDKKLNKWKEKIRDVGPKSNKITENIHETVTTLSSKLEEKRIKKNVEPPVVGIDYNVMCVRSIYYFIIGTNQEDWYKLYSEIEKKKIVDSLKKIAECAKNKMKKELELFHEEVEPFLKETDSIINDLDELIHNEGIKGTCQYISMRKPFRLCRS